MAGKGEMVCKSPTWFGVLVTLVGLWFVLGDMGILGTYGIGLWSLVILLIGIYLWTGSSGK